MGREEARRAEKIDSLAPEAKEAAIAAGLDKNQSALLANRIQARAVRRCGELLKQYNGQGARTDQLSAGAHTKLTQQQIARDAGMSRHQQVTAVRVANVPLATFEAEGNLRDQAPTEP